MLKNIFIYIFIAFVFFGCGDENTKKPLRIVSNAWIGYAPLFYAQEKGYLKKLNIKVIPVVSLAEAMDTFMVGKADMLTSTQHEYRKIKKQFKTLEPVILLDRSYGGDMILSNKTTKELKQSSTIDAYLEVDSINMDILDDFLKKTGISKKNIIFHNNDQSSLQSLGCRSKPTIIVTYVPYDMTFKKEGYFEVASTRNLDTIVVIDALCATKDIVQRYKSRLYELKKVIDRSIVELTNDKKNSYKIVSPYLDNISYKDYVNSFKTIKWINNPDKNIMNVIKQLGYEEDGLIKGASKTPMHQ